MALHLVRTKNRSLANPSLIRLFSTSSNNNGKSSVDGSNGCNSPSSISSYCSDVKASLRNEQRRERAVSSLSKVCTNPALPSSKPISAINSLEEIRKNLSEFRRRSAVPPPTDPSPSQSQPEFSLPELYRRNVLEKQGKPNDVNSSADARLSFDAIRGSLQLLRSNSGANDGNKKKEQSFSLSDFNNNLKLKPSLGIAVAELPNSIFGRKMEKKTWEGEALKADLVKIYTVSELGEKLKQLRPKRKEGEQWFSLKEMNERLMKLKEMEEREAESRIYGIPHKELRESLTMLKTSGEEKEKTSKRTDILDYMGRTTDFLLYPPKEHLVEQYFHPDNMSSAENLKIELAKVRDEFKMSESDCGSARVQVAQLTTKIKHLSSVLHKKDKHSRKGLLAMVQKRKKLLSYLRRTDWDSYVLVLSKLVLRDTPDYKVRNYTAMKS